MSNILVFMFIISVTTLDRPQEKEKNETFPVSKGFIHDEKYWTFKFDLIAAAHPQCNLFPLESYLSQLLALQPSNLEHHTCNFFFAGKHKEQKQKPPPLPSLEMTFNIDVRMASIQLSSPFLNA